MKQYEGFVCAKKININPKQNYHTTASALASATNLVNARRIILCKYSGELCSVAQSKWKVGVIDDRIFL